MAQRSTRLGPHDWLAAGRSALCDAGPSALKAEPLAVRLGVSKGSFYWHFRDVPAFQDILLSEWETDAVSRAARTDGTPVAQLRALAQDLADPDPTDRAVRSWAQGHDGARAAVERVDTARITLLHELLRETGIANPEMARIVYAAAVGMTALDRTGPSDNRNAMGSLVDLVLALR
nr:TetR/AcrR family transcriptional regulator [Roseovarius aestuariivivens]